MEVVALNVFVSRYVTERMGVDRLDPGSCESEIFRSRGLQSSEPRVCWNAVEGAPRSNADANRAWLIRVGGVLGAVRLEL
jgi:hypothetical protein